MTYTIDANVFIARTIATDVHHEESLAFLHELGGLAEPVFCPALVVAEAVAAVARVTGNPALALGEVAIVGKFPGMNLVNVTTARARRAARIAAAPRLRGADAVYAAVAVEYGATLVTWDAELLARGSGAVATMTPTAWLASRAAGDDSEGEQQST